MAETKTYTGGCHCGKIRYEVTTDLGRVNECNCSHCSRKGFLLNFVQPAQFKLLAGEGASSEYRFNKHSVQHLFCPVCGVQSYGIGNRPDGKQMVLVNVRCLEGVQLSSLAIAQVDGKSF